MNTLPPKSIPPITPSASHVSTATRPEDKVPLSQKMAYGAGGMAVTFYGQLPKQLATPVLVGSLGLSPTSVSLAMMIFRLFDAFLDPLMGWLSDNTRTRWGRRRPFIFVGALLVGLVLPVMWLINPAWSHTTQLLWFLGSGLLLYACVSVFAMPYESLNLELTPDYNERTSVTAYKAFAQKVAIVVIGWAWYFTQLPLFFNVTTGVQDTVKGALVLSVIVGAAICALGILPAIFVRERFYKSAANQQKISLRQSIRYTFSSRPFLILSGLTVCFASSYYLSNAMQFYLRLYYATGGDQALASKISGVELTLTMVLGIASIPCFSYLGQRIGKTWTLMVAMGLTFVALSIKWWIYNPAHPWLSMATPILLAPALTGIWQMIPSMTGDLADDDEVRTGSRREGAFASMYSWVVKASFTLGLTLAGPLVEWCGFEVRLGSQQTAEAIHAMRVADAVIPLVLISAAMVILLFYPLSPAKMREIRTTLESRRGTM